MDMGDQGSQFISWIAFIIFVAGCYFISYITNVIIIRVRDRKRSKEGR